VVFSNLGFYWLGNQKSVAQVASQGIPLSFSPLNTCFWIKELQYRVTKSINSMYDFLILAVAGARFCSHCIQYPEHPSSVFLVAHLFMLWRIEIDVTKKPMTRLFIKIFGKAIERHNDRTNADKTE